ncbi:hypothetical protein BV210_15675 [Halorientalis sp. IM1011]|uniref:hypothetical protein n=1 Tax=Halorientalis sp. IM1011 TaxID=1932360 RepID=UPI00097CCDA3|nr:hypothetical protein [Halorientalis sp. IM1011]AQL44052.1 hypothetical protein BV210_15675 [Halorientalis sp. IM1011]
MTAAFGFLIWSSVATLPSSLLTGVATAAAVVALGVLAAALATTAVPRVTAATDASGTAVAVLLGVGVSQLAVLIPFAAGSFPGVTTLASTVSYAVVAAAAAVGYDRTRSIWVPALALATYFVVTDLARVVAIALR